jgi:hypothetical protein
MQIVFRIFWLRIQLAIMFKWLLPSYIITVLYCLSWFSHGSFTTLVEVS